MKKRFFTFALVGLTFLAIAGCSTDTPTSSVGDSIVQDADDGGTTGEKMLVIIYCSVMDHGDPVSGVNVKVHRLNGSNWDFLGTATTDSGGMSEFWVGDSVQYDTFRCSAVYDEEIHQYTAIPGGFLYFSLTPQDPPTLPEMTNPVP